MPDDAGARTKRRDRAILHGALASGMVRIITAAASYVTLGIAARVLSTDEFGLVALLISFWLILTMFDMGLGGALTTRVAASYAHDDFVDIRHNVNHALFAMTAIGVLIAVGGSISAITLPWHDWIGGALPESTVVRSLIITFVMAGASMPAAVGFVILAGKQRLIAVQSGVAAAGVLALVASAAVAPLNPAPDVFVLAVLGGPLVVSLCCTSWALVGVFRDAPAPAGFEANRLKSMLRSSGWYALYNAGFTISLGTGTLIAGSVLGLVEAAIFSVAIRLFTPIITVVAASGAQLWPGMTEAVSRGDLTWVRSRYRYGVVSVAGISAVLSIILVAIGPWITKIWVGPALVPPLSLFVWTAVFTVSAAVTSQASVVLMAVERVRAAATLSVCTAIAGVGLSVFLAGAIGLNGAVVGSVVACLGILLPGIVLLARGTLNRLDAQPPTGSIRAGC